MSTISCVEQKRAGSGLKNALGRSELPCAPEHMRHTEGRLLTCKQMQVVCVDGTALHSAAGVIGHLRILCRDVHKGAHELPDIDIASASLDVCIPCYQAPATELSPCKQHSHVLRHTKKQYLAITYTP